MAWRLFPAFSGCPGNWTCVTTSVSKAGQSMSITSLRLHLEAACRYPFWTCTATKWTYRFNHIDSQLSTSCETQRVHYSLGSSSFIWAAMSKSLEDLRSTAPQGAILSYFGVQCWVRRAALISLITSLLLGGSPESRPLLISAERKSPGPNPSDTAVHHLRSLGIGSGSNLCWAIYVSKSLELDSHLTLERNKIEKVKTTN